MDYPRILQEFLIWFPDEQACLGYLERLRWGDGFVCPCCGTVDGGWWAVRRGLRNCAVCHHETSVTAGTIFHGSRLPLTSWFAAVWYVVNQKNGVSALGLQHVLEFGSYQTAWAWLHKLRRAMVLPGRELLSGVVEVDGSYVGARRTGAGGRRAAGKAIVAIAVEGDQVPERVQMRRIPNVIKDTLTDFVLDNVGRGSEVRTDGWQGYFDMDATASATLSPTYRPVATLLMWLYPTCIWCPRCFSAGSLAPTRVRSAMGSLTTTWTSSPFASTAAAHATVVCSSTDCSREHSPPARTPTQRSSRDVKQPETFSLQSSPIGGARWIASLQHCCSSGGRGHYSHDTRRVVNVTAEDAWNRRARARAAEFR